MSGHSIRTVNAIDLGLPQYSENILLRSGFEAIREELFPEYSSEEFRKRYELMLQTNGSSVAQSPSTNKRGAEMFWVTDNLAPIGVLVLHFYSWELLAPQICFLAKHNSKGEILNIKLARFEQLVNAPTPPKLVAELSSFWVNPEFRGKGIGRLLFEKTLSVFEDTLKNGDFSFTAARGKLGKDTGQKIFNYLLATEEKVNGKNENTNQINITGIEVDVDNLSQAVGIDCRNLPVHPDSLATFVLAQKNNMQVLGYFRTTSTLLGRLW